LSDGRQDFVEPTELRPESPLHEVLNKESSKIKTLLLSFFNKKFVFCDFSKREAKKSENSYIITIIMELQKLN
jgi:predicted membrane protein